jgi:hypothetical protein
VHFCALLLGVVVFPHGHVELVSYNGEVRDDGRSQPNKKFELEMPATYNDEYRWATFFV